MNNKEIKSDTSCNQSYDEDNRSTCSDVPRTDSPALVEKEPPIRVRDMINLYNFATQKNQELAHAKTLYYGANLNDTQTELSEMKLSSSQDKDMDGQASSSRLQNEKPIAGNFRVTTSDDQTSLRETLKVDMSGGESVEKSYQSKTTIRRTEQGVRIIIDIFFDKVENDIDIVGSRVETDIPESRILADFQQHSLAIRSQKIKPTAPNV